MANDVLGNPCGSSRSAFGEKEMTVTRRNLALAPAALVIGVLLFAIGYSFRPSNASAQAGRMAVDAQRGANSQVERYNGTIISMNGVLFILREDDNNSWHRLDNQRTARKFLGKRVVVFGKLDSATNVIHVGNIEESRA
jgi:Protein of unknown function (DUF5818)